MKQPSKAPLTSHSFQKKKKKEWYKMVWFIFLPKFGSLTGSAQHELYLVSRL
jgi:hypothetical protein